MAPHSYDPQQYLKPGANLGFLVWLTLLGLPALLLFLILGKQNAL